MMDSNQVRVAVRVNTQLGEGLHWDGRRQCLWLVDIHGRRLIQWVLNEPAWREWATPERLGWVVPYADSGALLVGLQSGIARAVLGDAVELEWLVRPFGDNLAMRLNDAKADATGAVWAGSMNNDDGSSAEGCLFRLGPDGQFQVQDHGYTVANGPAISPDGRLLLHTDSARRLIFAFDLDATAGQISNKRVWKQFAANEGYPDGMCFDADGGLWVAHWGMGCISRFAPQGDLLHRVKVPAPFTSNVCFAGPALDRLFVSSARSESPHGVAGADEGGALFEVDCKGVRGLTGAPYCVQPAQAHQAIPPEN